MAAAVPDIELEAVLHRLLSTAVDLTGARYAAIGVLDEQRSGLERFVTHGVTDAERWEIGEPPRGTGVLGAVITDPRPLRVRLPIRPPRLKHNRITYYVISRPAL